MIHGQPLRNEVLPGNWSASNHGATAHFTPSPTSIWHPVVTMTRQRACLHGYLFIVIENRELKN